MSIEEKYLNENTNNYEFTKDELTEIFKKANIIKDNKKIIAFTVSGVGNLIVKY